MGKVMVVIAIVVAAVPVASQNWTVPRTPWGAPDLQGLWPSAPLLSVPFERPVKLGTHAKGCARRGALTMAQTEAAKKREQAST